MDSCLQVSIPVQSHCLAAGYLFASSLWQMSIKMDHQGPSLAKKRSMVQTTWLYSNQLIRSPDIYYGQEGHGSHQPTSLTGNLLRENSVQGRMGHWMSHL
eukprot:854303-Rhodomonas_salina.2